MDDNVAPLESKNSGYLYMDDNVAPSESKNSGYLYMDDNVAPLESKNSGYLVTCWVKIIVKKCFKIAGIYRI
jgi:hypothetical protein